ncbi:MAG: SH3 domain-containing protein [Elusimicrobiota bacterium]|nr:SH3 domain-containing protein [Elusimicrobiota bacterium]
MKKYLLIIFSIMLIYSKSYSSNQVEIYGIISIPITEEIIIEKLNEHIYTYDGLVVYLCYMLKYNEQNYPLQIYLRPRNEINIEQIKKYTNINSVLNFQASFGQGDVYKFIIKRERGMVEEFNVGNKTIIKFISEWGSEYSRDILAYNFDLTNNRVFDSCLIQMINLWPDTKNFPAEYGLDFINKLIEKNDERVIFYKIIDNIVKNIKIYDSKEIYGRAKVKNLRLREGQNLKSNTVRLLNEDEKLIILEKGNEEIIDNNRGFWIKVKTEKNEIGWCFDYYIEY